MTNGYSGGRGKQIWEFEANLVYSETLRLEEHFLFSLPTGPFDDSVFTHPPTPLLHTRLEYTVVKVWSSNPSVSVPGL